METKFYGAFVLILRVDLHAIDATPARWRGDAGSSPLDRASAATSSPRSAPDTLVDFHTGANVSSLLNSISWAGTSNTSRLNVTKIAAMNVLMMSNINTVRSRPGLLDTVAKARGVKINEVASMHAKRNPAQNS